MKNLNGKFKNKSKVMSSVNIKVTGPDGEVKEDVTIIKKYDQSILGRFKTFLTEKINEHS